MRTPSTVSEVPEEPSSSSALATLSSRRSGIRLNGQIVIWGLALVFGLATASECRSITYFPSLVYGAVLWGWWGCIASLIWKLSSRRPATIKVSPRSVLLHLFAASLLGTLHLLALWSLGFTSLGWQEGQTASSVAQGLFNANRFGIELLIYGFIVAIASIAQFQLRVQREALKSLELQRQLSAAHLRALQMQLEPHFLFNTLNAITTLVELGRQKQASEMLHHLNAILKRTLVSETPEKVPLSQELEIVENYLAIEQVRFADRLRIEIKVDPTALDGLVPCFLLQPIVENAIRHGISRCEADGVVEAYAAKDGRNLQLRVRDSGIKSARIASNGHGIGLRNTRDRLAHFYPNEHKIKAETLPSGDFEVAITIPFENRRK